MSFPFNITSMPASAPKQGDDHLLISEALAGMSLNERENVYHELHGVSKNVEESPELLLRSLTEMENHLVEMMQWNRGSHLPINAYNEAQQLGPAFVHNVEVRLSFLRASDLDPKEAAKRFILYFDFKRSIFPPHLLCKSITWDDLFEEDQTLLLKGHFQRLPERDQAGRVIAVAFQGQAEYSSPESLGRCVFYSAMKTGEKIVTIIIYGGHPHPQFFDARYTTMYIRAMDALPFGNVSNHHCIADTTSLWFKFFLSVGLKSAAKNDRARVKIHEGSLTEWTYKLMTFGIPHRLIPITSDGKIKTKNHLELLEMEIVLEKLPVEIRNDPNRLLFSVPRREDVLMGKGKPINEHHGNMVLQRMIDSEVGNFLRFNRQERHTLALSIVNAIKASGGDFLSKDSGIWMNIPIADAQEKVIRTFRVRSKVWRPSSQSSSTPPAQVRTANQTYEEGRKRLRLEQQP